MGFWELLQQYWLCGFAGGLAHEVLTYGGLSIGSYDAEKRVLRLGFVGSAIIGILIASVVDGSEVTAFVAAMAGPQGLEGLTRLLGREIKRRQQRGRG